MPNYDFTASLSPLDFELLSKDLLEAELGVRLENFRQGPDKGIDLRYAPSLPERPVLVVGGIEFAEASQTVSELIVQCKRYATFTSLKSELVNSELPKITNLKPSR